MLLGDIGGPKPEHKKGRRTTKGEWVYSSRLFKSPSIYHLHSSFLSSIIFYFPHRHQSCITPSSSRIWSHPCSLVPFLLCLGTIFHIVSFPYRGALLIPWRTVSVLCGTPSFSLPFLFCCDAVFCPLSPCISNALWWFSPPFVVVMFLFTPATFLHVPVSSVVACHYCLLRHSTLLFPFFVAPRSRSCSSCLLARSSPLIVPLSTIFSTLW